MNLKNKKLIRITTVPSSLVKLLEGQLEFMSNHYDVTAISSDKEELEKYGYNTNIPVFYLGLTRKITPFEDIKAIIKLYKFLKKEKPYIVHTHTPKAGLVGMIASYLSKVPHRLHTVAGLPLMEATGIKRFILNQVERITYRLASKIYPNSEGLYDFILKNNYVKKDKLKIIGNGSSNGIDNTHFSPSIISNDIIMGNTTLKQLSKDDFVFVFVGRLVSDKGVNELVSAFESINIEHPGTCLLLVGPLEKELDPLLPETVRIIEQNSKIFTTGFVDDVRPYFAFAKALVFPSYREGFPNVVLQASAMGLPCIVSDINGCNEIITEGFNGQIVPAKSVQVLKQAMSKYIIDRELLESHACNARPAILASYERQEVWSALLAEYKSLASN